MAYKAHGGRKDKVGALGIHSPLGMFPFCVKISLILSLTYSQPLVSKIDLTYKQCLFRLVHEFSLSDLVF